MSTIPVTTDRSVLEADKIEEPVLGAKSGGSLAQAVERGSKALLDLQHPDGFWCFELEADCTIPAEYVLMMHFMDEIDVELEKKIGVYLRENQQEDGGWPLYRGGDANLSCTVKAYYALKIIGDAVDAPHMERARAAVLSRGGAARSNVFTRITLALFGQLPWRGVPLVPVEIMLFPRWFPFHLSKVSYWSRTVMVPLAVLCTLKARATNPRQVGVRELFVKAPEKERDYFPVRSPMNRVFVLLDKIAHLLEPLIPVGLRRLSMKRAEEWIIERLNGEGGLGAIFPAMVNAYGALDRLGYTRNHPYCATAREALRGLLVVEDERAYCQPCVSPVWDTGLAALALLDCDAESDSSALGRAMDWLADRQLLEEPGDWREYRPNLRGGGWAFQFQNSPYPDLDDTAVIAIAMHILEPNRYRIAIERACEWIAGMQSRNGGFAAFDADNDHYYLNEIPFADHGALLDPPTSDVSARCLMLLSQCEYLNEEIRQVFDRCLHYLMKEQEDDGSWFGRWGTNYVYGTWSVLIALEAAGVDPKHPSVRKAVTWLKKKQREDGGWGESNDSYDHPVRRGQALRSTSFQTAWAVHALIAAGEGDCEAVDKGVDFLLNHQESDGLWHDPEYTAPGFPRVFYLKYHGYDKFFPLWALARYRNFKEEEPGRLGAKK